MGRAALARDSLVGGSEHGSGIAGGAVMAKRKKKRDLTACAYCAELGTGREDEHVFPKSWYPDDFTNDQMLRVPACSVCNRASGKVEERLMTPFVVSLPPSARTKSLFDRVVRALDPQEGTGVRDVSYRKKRGDDFFRRTGIVGRSDAITNALWTPAGRQIGPMSTPAGLLVEGTPIVRFRPADLRAFTLKLLRGCYFGLHDKPLPQTARCEASPFTSDPRAVIAKVQRAGARAYGAWPFEYLLLQSPNDPTMALWFFALWDHHILGATSNVPTSRPQG